MSSKIIKYAVSVFKNNSIYLNKYIINYLYLYYASL